MFIIPLLFLLDILAYIIFNGWFLYSLFFLFLLVNFEGYKNRFYWNCLLIFFILLQDFFIFGTIGLSLVYILPILLFSFFLNKLLNINVFILALIFIIFLLIVMFFYLKGIILGLNIASHSTFFFILANLALAYFIFLGMPGNHL